jgi:hypothetical protein
MAMLAVGGVCPELELPGRDRPLRLELSPA